MSPTRDGSPLRLLVMRHCKSDWNRDDAEDFDRPLSRRGLRDARRMGNLVRKARLTPELIVASPAARTRRTAEIVAERCGYGGSISWQRSFYGTEIESYLTEIRGIGRGVSTALIVGHNPALEQVAAALTGGLIRLPTGALVLVEAGTDLHPLRRWADLSPGGCTLKWLVVPRLLRSLR